MNNLLCINKEFKVKLITCLLTILSLLLFFVDCEAQKPKLKLSMKEISNQIIAFNIYDTYDTDLLKLQPEDLLKIASRGQFDIELFKMLIPNIKYKEAEPFRTTSYIGIIELKNGTHLNVLLSVHGAFYEFIGYKGFFYFEGKSEEKYMDEIYRIVNDVFQPARQEKQERGQQ